jgi:hypothetical protein
MADDQPAREDWGRGYIRRALAELGHDPDGVTVETEAADVDGLPRGSVAEQGFRLVAGEGRVSVTAPREVGRLYGLVEAVDRARHDPEFSVAGDQVEVTDAPRMRYRGYAVPFQGQTAYYPDHKPYDWPVTPDAFPWFYDREFLTRLLDRLVAHKANTLYIWSGHPFASLVDVTDEYPAAPEVDSDQLAENIEQYRWLVSEAEKRGIRVIQHFYNIHMSDPLARERGWDILSGEPHPEIAEYTRACLSEFAQTYPSAGLMPTMGERLEDEYQAEWLTDVILPGFLDGLAADREEYPPMVVRAHSTDLAEYFGEAKAAYPNISTIWKHNSENYVSTTPSPDNDDLARRFGSHIVNLHLASNFEPFTWGSPRFIRETIEDMLSAGAAGVHVYPLRYWDFPNSAHVTPFGDQLHEQFLWWSAWSRYAWNPDRDPDREQRYWTQALARQYSLPTADASGLLAAVEETAEVLPRLTGQFTVAPGNLQADTLGLQLVPMAFTNRQHEVEPGYEMAQLIGNPLVDKPLFEDSPVARVDDLMDSCDAGLDRLADLEDAPVVEYTRHELEVVRLLASFYRSKATACALYFQDLYGLDVDTDRAEAHLADSVDAYREVVDRTTDFFEDVASLHHYRWIPAPVEEAPDRWDEMLEEGRDVVRDTVEEGYRHWEDMLPDYEQELAVAREEGIEGLLEMDYYLPGAATLEYEELDGLSYDSHDDWEGDQEVDYK